MSFVERFVKIIHCRPVCTHVLIWESPLGSYIGGSTVYHAHNTLTTYHDVTMILISKINDDHCNPDLLNTASIGMSFTRLVISQTETFPRSDDTCMDSLMTAVPSCNRKLSDPMQFTQS